MAEVKKETKEVAKETKTIRLPIVKGEALEEFYSINFKNYIIKRGENVEVPKELYDLIMEQQEAADEAYIRSEELKMKADK